MKENNAINCQILKNHPTPFYSWPRLISLKSFLSFFFLLAAREKPLNRVLQRPEILPCPEASDPPCEKRKKKM